MKKFGLVLGFLILFFSLANSAVSAAEFSLRPGSGQIRKGANFTIDILINTEGEASNLARAVLTFDPNLVQVTSADKNASLYCDYPEDEQSVDNENGVVMLTGFCQTGEDVLYSTEDEADVFARVKFKAVRNGNLVLDWEYTGEDEPFNSVVMTDGSPPLDVLEEKPIAGAYAIVTVVDSGPTPNTGYTVSIGMIIAGFLLLSIGIVYIRYRDQISAPKIKGKTVVVYGKEN